MTGKYIPSEAVLRKTFGEFATGSSSRKQAVIDAAVEDAIGSIPTIVSALEHFGKSESVIRDYVNSQIYMAFASADNKIARDL